MSDEMREYSRGFLQLARNLAALKALPRTGWSDRGVNAGLVESVADHSLAVAVLAWAMALERVCDGEDLDPHRVLVLGLIHDLAESEAGDAPPYDPADLPNERDAEDRRTFLNRRHVRDDARAAAKRTAEDEAMRRICAALPPAAGRALASAWEELRTDLSAEARFVKQVDKLETFLQSTVYEQQDPSLPMDSFRQEVLERLDDPLLAGIRDAALKADAEESLN
jgi:5'-deoxynucleotidase YfbR-like HD superfamily hydrolase